MTEPLYAAARTGRSLIQATAQIEVIANLTPGTSRVLLTFGDMMNLANGQRAWGDRIALAHGMGVVAIMAKQRHWYPSRAIDEVAETVRALLRDADHVIAYGGSMGGYGALKHGARLGAGAAIAYVPQFTIDPSVIDDPRYSPYFDPVSLLGMEITGPDLPPHAIIVGDPHHRIDAAHIGAVVALRQGGGGQAGGRDRSLTTIPVLNVGHDATAALAGSSFFATLLDVVTGDLSRGAAIRQASRIKRNSPLVMKAIAQKLVARHPAIAARLIATLTPDDQSAQNLVVFIADAVTRRVAARKGPPESVIAALRQRLGLPTWDGRYFVLLRSGAILCLTDDRIEARPLALGDAPANPLAVDVDPATRTARHDPVPGFEVHQLRDGGLQLTLDGEAHSAVLL